MNFKFTGSKNQILASKWKTVEYRFSQNYKKKLKIPLRSSNNKS